MPIRRILSALMVLVLASVACSLVPTTTIPRQSTAVVPPTAIIPPTAIPPTATPTIPKLTLEQIKNAEIQITGVSDTNKTRTVKLTDGKFEAGNDRSAPDYVSVSMGEPVAFGDLNGDGLEDAAIIIGENYGGSGDFISVAALLNQNGQPVFAGSNGIDDRAKINTLNIQNGEILAESVVHSPNDPLCCPTQAVKQSYALWSGKLVLTHYVSKVPDGAERSIKIESPAPGAEVSSPFTLNGSVTIVPFENSLAYSVFLEGTPDPVVQSSLTVIPVGMGAGVFQLPLDFTAAGVKGNLRIEISDISPADGSYLAIATLFVTVK